MLFVRFQDILMTLKLKLVSYQRAYAKNPNLISTATHCRGQMLDVSSPILSTHMTNAGVACIRETHKKVSSSEPLSIKSFCRRSCPNSKDIHDYLIGLPSATHSTSATNVRPRLSLLLENLVKTNQFLIFNNPT